MGSPSPICGAGGAAAVGMGQRLGPEQMQQQMEQCCHAPESKEIPCC